MIPVISYKALGTWQGGCGGGGYMGSRIRQEWDETWLACAQLQNRADHFPCYKVQASSSPYAYSIFNVQQFEIGSDCKRKSLNLIALQHLGDNESKHKEAFKDAWWSSSWDFSFPSRKILHEGQKHLDTENRQTWWYCPVCAVWTDCKCSSLGPGIQN